MSDDTRVTISAGGVSFDTTLGAMQHLGKDAKAGKLPALQKDVADLVAVVEHARSLLDAGDVERALKLSAVAYDQAKAAAGSAERVKASRELVDKARRMQADALKIESMCYVAMADAVDEAQAKGQLSRGGRPETVQSEDRFSLEEVGVDKRRLHEARKLRNAVRAEPEFVERIVEARLSEGLEPSRAALKKAAGHAVGTKTATKDERGDDLYETPIEAMRTLLALESFGLNVLEPSVGKGAILRPLEDAGYEVTISDLVDRGITTKHGECQGVGDFLRSIAEGGGWDIVTNPPYGVANAYAAHALREHRPRKMALLLNLNFMCGFEDRDRQFVMDECPPSRVYVFTRRLPMMHRDGWDGNKASSQMNTAWFIWERNEDGSYGNGWSSWKTIRVDWERYQDEKPLAPGEGDHMPPIRRMGDEFARETPRKTVEERVDEERARALVWIAEQESFDVGGLRRGIGVRGLVAEALIAEFSDRELITPFEGGWKISAAGMTALEATAAVLLVGKAVAEPQATPASPRLPHAPGKTAPVEFTVGGMKKGSSARLSVHLNDDGTFAVSASYDIRGFCGGSSPPSGKFAAYESALRRGFGDLRSRLTDVAECKMSTCSDSHRAAARAGVKWIDSQLAEWGLVAAEREAA